MTLKRPSLVLFFLEVYLCKSKIWNKIFFVKKAVRDFIRQTEIFRVQ